MSKLLQKTILTALLLVSVQSSSYILLASAPVFKDTVSIMVLGDVMMHSRQIGSDYSLFLKHLSPEMARTDFCVANMEFALGGEPYTGYPSFSAPDSVVHHVYRAGANVFLLANNHILDKGTRGLARTEALYQAFSDSLGTGYTGLDGETLFLKKGGVMVALVNFTYGTNAAGKGDIKVNLMDREQVGEQLEFALEEADLVVALPHWGEEYVLKHSSQQQEWARWLAEKGVDAIVGAHPHVVQDTTHIGPVPVVYSLGNAVSNMSAINTRLGLTVTLRVVYDWDTDKVKLLEPQLRFIWCTLPGMLTDGYATIFVDQWVGRRHLWKNPYDYDNMLSTWKRVKAETGIE